MSYPERWKTLPFFHLIMLLVLSASLLTACSKKEDVRLVLCQDLTIMLLNSPDDYVRHEYKIIMKGYEDLEVKLLYSTTGADGTTLDNQASCFYAYVQEDVGMETFNTPSSAYDTYPNKVVFEGHELQPKTLAPLIEQVMIKQAKETVSKIKENINQKMEGK